MTPKERAEELVEKFMPDSDYNECDVFTQRENQLKNAISCALILIDEIFEMQSYECDYYYECVKKEILKL